ncbi:DUF7507 domain-containing protein [Paenibacillus urinalis]|uniref:DUF11 domain-containing protein n=1 Tax=Paenibacillus urinalis TaxID=521520 RepID=A0AAX3N7L8_9BACL|nr:hypothetical protein [Paenibacillus urinalis]WDH84704.1 hypothetical protein PUW23_11025 [Paenibacillus urinalis]
MTPIPLVLRATYNATGAITFTGNTLGLSRSNTEGVPGTLDSIGAFITTNSAVRFGTYPLGTTSSYQSNNSSAVLVLPSGSTVLYAELIWGGSYINGSVNLSSAINNPVIFTTPASTSSVTPDPTTYNAFDLGNGAQAYVRSANVTSLVQQGGAGTYITGGVVGTIVVNNDTTANHAGWTLAVIYNNPTLPFRNMTLRAGGLLVNASNQSTITGFATPTSGALGGRALFSAQEGDANRTGDSAQFGPTAATLVSLSGPNNFANNFFASQINNDAGQLNTTGSFGTSNQTNGAPGTNIIAGRQGWDITNVDISARLVNNQTSAVLNLTTSGDVYIVNANALQININSPNITVSKSANVSGLVVGDTVIYSVVVANTGTANAANVVLTDVLPAGLTFVTGSVTVAGTQRPTLDIRSGVPIGTLNLSSSVTITYRATVTSIPSPQQVVNTANAAFTFQSVAGGSTISGVIPSNAVTLPVYAPIFNLVKSSNIANATVGDTLTYSVAVTNSGNIGATTTFTDNVPAGTSYVPGSFQVNGNTIAGANPATGVNIGVVAAGSTSQVTFQVVVNSLPSPPTLNNLASVSYTYQPPDGRVFSGSAASNTLSTPVSLPNVAVSKTANLTDAAVGEVLTYTTVIANNGTTALGSIVFTDVIPAGTSLVPGSVTVNGVTRNNANPGSGISLPSITGGSSSTVTFQVLIQSVPASGQVVNQASVAYRSGTFNGLGTSNTVSTPVYQPIISAVKALNDNYATIGDTITVNISLQNTGNIGAQVSVTDPIPAGTLFVPGSVTIGGTSVPGADPVSGIFIGTLTAGSTNTITFQLQVASLPSPPSISNTASANYSYVLPSGRTLTGTRLSNNVTIPVSAPNVTVNKIANATEAAIGDVITYTLTASNNGVEPVSNVIVSDTIPQGTVFVPGSVRVNGVVSQASNPSAGVAIGSVPGQSSVVVSFQLQVAALNESGLVANQANVAFTSGTFTGASVSNTVILPVYNADISIAKSASLSNVTVGQTLTYTFILSNTGNTPAFATLFDELPPEVVFDANSVVIDGQPTPGADPVTGINITSIPVGGTTTVTFIATVNDLPASQRVINQADVNYFYQTGSGRTLTGTASSNSVTVNVSAPNVTLSKTPSRTTAIVGDSIIYTLVVTNNGGATINNIVLSDMLPSQVSFIPGSATVNGTPLQSASPQSGIPIGSLAPAATRAVTFEVNVTMAVPSEINNQSTVSFTSGVFSGTSNSNTSTIPVIQPQISLQKTASTSNATVGDTIVYTVVITNAGNLAADLVLTDTIPAGTTFSPNSVIVQGSPVPGVVISDGVSIGTIAAGQSVTVSFAVVVTSLPSPQLITNQASSVFTFTPPDNRTLTGTAVSNTVSFPVSAPDVEVTKSSSLADVSLGDIITFTVTTLNEGIAPVTNVLFSDPTPGTTFIPGSVTINGVPDPYAFPSGGIDLGTITPGTSTTVTYNVSVDTVPSPPQITNQAAVTYTSGAFTGTTYSNTPVIPVYEPVLNAVKSGSTLNATVGDTITYTISVANSGNYAASFTLTDPIPAGTSFVANSVLINGLPAPGADPSVGIPAGVVSPGTSTTIMFSVVIDTLPSPQILSNQSFIAYAYTLPSGRTLSDNTASNVSVITVSAPNVAVVKISALTALSVGDINTYSVNVTNNGIAAVNNVILSDPLPSFTNFVPGSVTVDAVSVPAANPSTGINIGSIPPGASVNVTFQVQVNALPPTTPAELTNRTTVTFTSGTFSGSAFSNTVTTPVFQPILTAVKSANTANATVGDTVVYSIVYSNAGNYGANVILTDNIPAGTTLVPNSVIVNGAPIAGANPAAGIDLGVISTTATVLFSVTVDSLPVSQQLSNQANSTFTYTLPDGRTLNGSFASNLLQIPVSSPNVTLVKSVSVPTAVVGDTITYSIVITNNGITNVTNAVLSDVLPSQSSFVPGSVTINGVTQPNANPAGGISIGTLAPGASATVTFAVSINALPPAPYTIENQSSISFTTGTFTGASYSNTVSTAIYQPIFNLVKTASSSNATVGDTIVYFLSLTNNGNLPGDMVLFDDLPTGTVLVPNSVLINGVPQPGANPGTGIPVGLVQPGSSVAITVTLQVVVDTLPNPQQLVNQATGNYTYSPPDGRVIYGTVSSNVLVIPVSSPDVSVVKSSPAIDAVVGDVITYTVVITNNGITEVNNVIMVDPVPVGTVFVTGSVTVDGVPRPSANPNSGINVGTIEEGTSVTVTFQVQVVMI